MDYEKVNSLSSDEGGANGMQGGSGGSGCSVFSGISGVSSGGGIFCQKVPQNSPNKLKCLMAVMTSATANTLAVQSPIHLGQSLPNLNLNSTHSGQNTLLVPGSSVSSNLLSPSHRGISYPPPSPTR